MKAFKGSAVVVLACLASCSQGRPAPTEDGGWKVPGIGRLPTGATLDPIGVSTPVGAMPLGAVLSPDRKRLVLSLSGWRVQGIQVLDRATGKVVQTVHMPSAFVGLAFTRDGRELFASAGNADAIYRFRWDGDTAVLRDSVVLAAKARGNGTRYPAGLALSPDGATLYVAENLGDAVAVVDVATGKVREHKTTPKYPYAIAVAPDGQVFVSAWTGNDVVIFRPTSDGKLEASAQVAAGRHPSALLLNRDGSRLYVASASTDRVTVIDTRTRRVISTLDDAGPATTEGSTPNALALSDDEQTLYVAEADNNAVARFDLGPSKLVGRMPVGWYPTSLVVAGDTMFVANGKGSGTRANLDGPTPAHPRTSDSHSYTLGQLEGSVTVATGITHTDAAAVAQYSARVAHANRWDIPGAGTPRYPPFEHVIYIVKENRTFDQMFGDLSQADADSSLLFFPRAVSPNHHALAERFGIFDRFFVNAEVSPDGHNWSMASYATDYLEKTVPSNYSARGRSYDYEGTNRGRDADDDAASPANGYLWDAAAKAHVTMRNYGEFVTRTDRAQVEPPDESGASRASRAGTYRGNKPALRPVTSSAFPGFDLDIRDQVRADIWLDDFKKDVKSGAMPQLEIVRLPNDHTAGMRAGSPSPRAMVADNDLALGRMVEAVSKSPYWKNTVFFVLEDDAQNGPDHVDSHRSVLLVVSAYNAGGVMHRWVNTSDVVSTILEIVKAPHLSQFDTYGRPLREIWAQQANETPFAPLVSSIDSTEKNPAAGRGARDSQRLNLSKEDVADEDIFNRVLWRGIKGDVPYPGAQRLTPVEWKRAR